jgi:uncharacterized protein (TIGR02145 family)
MIKKSTAIIMFIGVFVLVFLCGINLSNGTITEHLKLVVVTKAEYAHSSDFKTVKIGKQEWAAENLNVSNFRNGDAIPEAKNNEDWINAYENGKPVWCYYNYDPQNGKKYGKLYNWFVVKDSRGLAPAGWHIPTDAEWIQLMTFLGGDNFNLANKKMKTTTGWDNKYVGNGTNESGFSGLPGGTVNYEGNFYGIGRYGLWWSSTEESTINSWVKFLRPPISDTHRRYDRIENGFSVRCVKD